MSNITFPILWFGFILSILGQETMDVFRLPDTIKPESYDILIAPILSGQNSCYSGDVKIVIYPMNVQI